MLAGCHGNHLSCGFLVLRMPWKGMSSLHLRGGESASYLLSRARLCLRPPVLLCLTWAVVSREELDTVEVRVPGAARELWLLLASFLHPHGLLFPFENINNFRGVKNDHLIFLPKHTIHSFRNLFLFSPPYMHYF